MNDTEYQPSPASLFSSHARKIRTEPITLWAYCPNIMDRVEMTWTRDQGNSEYYSCPCGQEHSWVVR